MSKSERREILGKFIGLKVAHQILIKGNHLNNRNLFVISYLANNKTIPKIKVVCYKLGSKPESIRKMQLEIDHYDALSVELAEGNWNEYDLVLIRNSAEKRCRKKLDEYGDIGQERYILIEQYMNDALKDLDL